MATNASTVTSENNEWDSYSAKPHIFDGEKFDYWKDRIESYFLGFDLDPWDLVVAGYSHPVDSMGKMIARSDFSEAQKKTYKNHHRARTILLNVISYTEYEKITNKETVKSIFDSLQMTHEGNAQVKETKALALVQKYEAFRMEEDESVETMFQDSKCLLQDSEFWTKVTLQLIMSKRLSGVSCKMETNGNCVKAGKGSKQHKSWRIN